MRSRRFSPVDALQRDLAKQEEQLRLQTSELTKLIDDSPRRKEEQLRRRRKELQERASTFGNSRDDLWTTLNVSTTVAQSRKRPTLRRERTAARIRLMVYLLVLGAVLLLILWQMDVI